MRDEDLEALFEERGCGLAAAVAVLLAADEK